MLDQVLFAFANGLASGMAVFLVAAGVTLVFGLLRILNFAQGSFFMLGAAFTLQRKGHVRTDSFYMAWPPRRQAKVDLACYLLMFLPFVSVFAFVGWGYFWKAFTTGETFVTSAWQPITIW